MFGRTSISKLSPVSDYPMWYIIYLSLFRTELAFKQSQVSCFDGKIRCLTGITQLPRLFGNTSKALISNWQVEKITLNLFSTISYNQCCGASSLSDGSVIVSGLKSGSRCKSDIYIFFKNFLL